MWKLLTYQTKNLIYDTLGGYARHLNNKFDSSDAVDGKENEVLNKTMSEDCREFYEVLHDRIEELYKGCTKYSKLPFLLKLYHIG